MSLKQFLNNHKAAKGEQFTHTSMTGGSWIIPDDELNNFYKLYARDLLTQEWHLTERHIPHSGSVIIDFDFKFKDKSPKRLITEQVI
ncbi:MAG: hypothetical protein EOP45_16915, partial [Sphingobacteriaceae bacterium]